MLLYHAIVLGCPSCLISFFAEFLCDFHVFSGKLCVLPLILVQAPLTPHLRYYFECLYQSNQTYLESARTHAWIKGHCLCHCTLLSSATVGASHVCPCCRRDWSNSDLSLPFLGLPLKATTATPACSSHVMCATELSYSPASFTSLTSQAVDEYTERPAGL